MNGRGVAPALARKSEAERVERLLDAASPQRALAAASRALLRRPLERDEQARLRLLRSQALWRSGRGAAARVELEKARRIARGPETRTATHVAEALYAWRELRPTAARSALERAQALQSPNGAASAQRACIEAGLLKDQGRLNEALAVVDAGILAAEMRAHIEWQGRLLAERAGLRAALGRWSDARGDAEAAREAFRRLEDRREWTVAGLAAAALDLAKGDLEGARGGLERARSVIRAEPGDPRAEAELSLQFSDLHLAAGSLDEACRAASEALTLFAASGDRRGQGLAQVRHAHALLAAGRLEDALVAARRAVRRTPEDVAQLRAWAELALGRVLLRIESKEARGHFAEARRLAGERPDLQHLARLGEALAAGQSRDARQLKDALDALLAWGDRRIVSFGAADVRDLVGGQAEARAAPPRLARPCLDGTDPRARCLVDLALALASSGAWTERWATGMRALRSVVPWQQAVLVGEGALELRGDLDAARPLEAGDLFEALAKEAAAPTAIDLRTESRFRDHPTRLLHGVDAVAIAPLGSGNALCLALPDGAPLPMDLISEAARLVAAHLPAAGPREDAAAPMFPGLLGRCAAMRELFAHMSKAAASEAFVYVSGETGTGKGRVALAVHERSRRRGARLVAVNAASLSDELFEAELFGHARGAFTGAVAAREGYVAEAQGGTLFIDEVSELSPRGQAKLLRLLQEREYRRLGETEVRRADVRVVSAANVDLEERVARGLFREDLLYRLAVVTLRLPPLRERGDDVLQLARHFLRQACARDGRPAQLLPRAIAQALLRHSWPGNVRELDNEMSRLVAMSGTDGLELGALSPRVRNDDTGPAGTRRLREALLGFERSFVSEALERNSRNRTRTAAEIGISRQALLGKMSRLGVA